MIDNCRSNSGLEIQSVIINNLHTDFYKIGYLALEKNNEKAINNIIDFVTKTVYESVTEKNLPVFNQLIYIPIWFYELTVTKFPQLQNIIFQKTSSFFRDIIRYGIAFSIKKNPSLNDRKEINDFIYYAYYAYLNFFYKIISNKQFPNLLLAIPDYNKLFNDYERLPYDLTFKIRDLYKSNQLNQAENEEEQAIIEYYSNVTHLNSSFALTSWLYYLYSLNELEENILSENLTAINFNYEYLEDFINDTVKIIDLSHWGHFGLSGWDYIERPPEVTYSPPQPYIWLTYGMTITLLKSSQINQIDINIIKNVKDFYFLFGNVKANLFEIKNNFEKWKSILNCATIEEFEERSRIVLNIFSQLRRRYQSLEEKKIGELDISPDLVEKFQTIIKNAWERGSKIKQMFKYFGNLKPSFHSEKEYEVFRRPTFFTKAKTMFTEQNYQHIYGIEDLGAQLGRSFDGVFFKKSIEAKEYLQFDTISTAIDSLLKSLHDTGYVANLIIMPPEFLLADELQSNDKFISKWYLKEKLEMDNIGTYDGVPVSQTYSKYMSNKIMVCVFDKAFELEIFEKENSIPKDVDITVKSISNDEAKIQYEKNPNKWEIDNDGIKLSYEEAINLIKTSVNINMEIKANFIMKNSEAFFIGEINPVALKLI